MASPAAEPIFHLGLLPVTNALINGWIAVVFFVALAMAVRASITHNVPGKLQNAMEALVELALVEFQKVTGDRVRAVAFLPIVGSLFLFILFSNWLGLIPGTGSIGRYLIYDGHLTLVPLLRPAASDLNLTLGIALFAVLGSHAYALRALGFADHVSKFINLRGIWRSFRKGPIAILVAVIEFGVGIIEIVSEGAKVLSLSLRLFGNVFAGEVLMTVILGLFAFVLPIPFMFLEVLVGIVQATVFSLLTLAYLTVATSAHEHDDKEHAEHEGEVHEPAHA